MLLCVDILLFHSKCIKLSLCFGIRNALALPISEFSTKGENIQQCGFN